MKPSYLMLAVSLTALPATAGAATKKVVTTTAVSTVAQTGNVAVKAAPCRDKQGRPRPCAEIQDHGYGDRGGDGHRPKVDTVSVKSKATKTTRK